MLQLPLIFWLILIILAVENFTDMLTTLDLFEHPRAWFEKKFGAFGKLARCFFCQSFWLNGILTGLLFFNLMPIVVYWIILWFATHKVIQYVNEFSQRYFGRAPLSVFITREKNQK